MGHIAAVLSVALIVMSAAAQAPVEKPTFEVVSIKPNMSGQQGGGGGPRNDRYVVTNVPLTTLLNVAFSPAKGRLYSQQIIGGPEWVRKDRFDVEAKMMRPDVPYDQVKLMVQALLEDRFQLKWHREMRDVPVYEVTVAKSGLKMRQSPDQNPPDPKHAGIYFGSLASRSEPLPRGAIRLANGPDSSALIGNAVRVSMLVELLQGQADRIVFDKTGLPALFDFDLQYNNEVTALDTSVDDRRTEQSLPSLFTAIQELGLKLEPAKAAMEVIIIDSVQKPTVN